LYGAISNQAIAVIEPSPFGTGKTHDNSVWRQTMRIRLMVWLIVLLLGLYPTAAQREASIIFLRGNERDDIENDSPAELGYGDLYTWTPGDAEPFRLTNWGFNRAPALSPDGGMIAYQSVPEAIVAQAEAFEFFFDHDRDAPNNIWLMDLTTLEATRAAVQTDGGQLRSAPIWSPDSRQIAWRERSMEDSRDQNITVYDVRRDRSELWFEGFGSGCSDGGIIHVEALGGWGSHIVTEYWPCKDTALPAVNFYTQDGLVRSEQINLTDRGYDYYRTRQWMWARRGDTWFYVIELPDSWLLLNTTSGERLQLVDAPLLGIPSGQGLRLRREDGLWTVIQPDEKETTLPETVTQTAISPDGQTVAYLDGGTAYRWEAGQIVEPLLPESTRDWQILSLDWSPLVWTADGEATPITG
jgi:hypothetical protein